MITRKMLIKIAEAVGDGTTWPRHIPNDPEANYYLDVIVLAPSFESLGSDLKRIYSNEVKTQ